MKRNPAKEIPADNLYYTIPEAMILKQFQTKIRSYA